MFFSRKEDFVVEMKHCSFHVPAIFSKEYPTLTKSRKEVSYILRFCV